MRRRAMGITAGATVLAVAMAAGLAVSGSATARGGMCPEGKICIWKDDGRSGQLVQLSKKGVSNKLAKKMNNEASSLHVARQGTIVLYDKKNAKGENRCFELGIYNNLPDFNDIASSTKIKNKPECPARKAAPLCPDGKLCLWHDNEGGGKRVKISGKRGASNKLAKEMNNEASSLINATEHRVYVYDKRDAKGDVRCYEPGDEVADMGADSSFNDVASSTKVTRGDTCFVDDPHRGGAGDCTKGTRALCVWAGPMGSGELVKIRGKGISNKLFKRMNNQATSAFNGRGKAAFLYDSKNGDGESVCIEPHDGIGDLGAYAFDDRATSSKNAAHGQCPV